MGLARPRSLVAGVALGLAALVAARAGRRGGPAAEGEPRYLTSARCGACHPGELEKWRTSHHALAMQPASESTLLGDFGGATLDVRGKPWRFFRRDDAFLVSAEGPDGQLHDYPVAYTFGVDPLQQLLVAFPGGRFQALSVAWDTRARRWFSLEGEHAVPPGDWLHWTRQAQNWNGMCADCHSTRVEKGYDPEGDSFRTTFAEVSVGCEACHGPGERHVAWAAAHRPAPDHGLLVQTSGLPGRAAVEACAPCHSRRAQFADQGLPGRPLLDRYLPATLDPGFFHADGQILGEDYEVQPFQQSKMYAKGVRCADCHDVHSGRPRAEGNALCTRCHKAETFDTNAHHHHPAGGEPSRCVSCHMPGQNYMVVHFRRDHSLRVPRPYLDEATGAPDACAQAGCHADRPAGWTSAAFDRLFGRPHTPHWGTVIAAARRGEPGSEDALAELARDADRPPIARATALELLGQRCGAPAALEGALADPEPLLRQTAAARLCEPGPEALVARLAPLLEDPIRAVRMTAAQRLAGAPASFFSDGQRRAQAAALDEYVAGQRYMFDMPSGPYNLGNLYAAIGRPREAEAAYRRALAIDDRLEPARVNLAMLLVGQGPERRAEVEQLLREVLAAEPGLAEVAYDLGLLLAEEGRADEAVDLLRQAVQLQPDEPRYAQALAGMEARARGGR